MDLQLNDRAFLITGGTDGLGLALARRLISEGAHVAVCGRNLERLDKAQELLGARALCFEADVTDTQQLDDFIDAPRARCSPLDCAVTTAGRAAGSLVATSRDEQWREDLELKVLSAVHVARRVLDALEQSRGVILNVLAVGARAPLTGSTPTTASRAAGLAFTKALANEVGPRGIRANAVLIGLIESGQWVRRAQEAGLDLGDFYRSVAESSAIPLGRFGRAEEFADLATFLLSPRSSYVTGVAISIDGGLSPVI